jgi:hypothetical protein
MNPGNFKELFAGYESAHSKTRLYKWVDANLPDSVQYTTDSGRHLIVGFKIKDIPEFNDLAGDKAEAEYFKCLLRQKTFIDTVDNIFLSSRENFNSTIELRIQNNPVSKTIECFLLLRLVTQFTHIDHDQLTAEFKRIVPDEYTLTPISKTELETLLHLGKQYLVEIGKADNLLPVGGVYQPGPVSLPPMNYSGDISKVRFYVPCTQYIDFNPYNWVDFYKILQELGEPVQLRISLSAVKLFEFEKNLALQYHNMLQATYAHAMNADTTGYLLSFNKYLTSQRLFSIKMQVAGFNETSVKSTANAFCTQLSHGKLKTQLLAFSANHQDEEIKRSDWTECNHYYRPVDLSSRKVENVNDLVESFLRRFNYLYDEVEATTLFRLPVAKTGGLPGMFTRPVLPFYQPNPRKKEREEISLGQIISSDRWEQIAENGALQYSFPVNDLTKHGLIVGSTGSGKTNTTLNFVKQLIEKNIPFLLIEPVKSEYYDELKAHCKGKLNRFNFKKPFLKDGTCNPEYLRFNPLVPMKGISIIQHISYIKGCFNAAFPMYGIMPLVLEECLYMLYERALGEPESSFFDAAVSPRYCYDAPLSDLSKEEESAAEFTSLALLKDVLDDYLDDKELFTDEDKNNFGAALKRRVGKLTKGVLGNCFCPHKWINRDDSNALIPDNLVKMFTEPTIIELEDLADNDDKALIMAFIMSYLFEYRQQCRSLKVIEKELGEENYNVADHIHITIIEEAHRLLSSGNAGTPQGGEDAAVTQDSKAKAISLFIDMLAEIRAKGEGIFIVEQIPTKLVSDVIKNTNLKIMHRITSKDDRKYLGEAMQMTELQQNYVNTLKTGQAIIFEEQLNNPVFVRLNRFL